MENNYKRAEDIGGIKADIEGIKEVLRDLKDNHIAHFYKKLDRLPTWAVTVIGLFSCAVGVLTTLLIRR